ncbi:VOC family protein [Hansschlegelia zhihuaiae]|uniref:VOC domain-containing protein n=1 Tax=Hansschlegelia zhihuaiae TaxID=405005 RepID=A0A4Q0M7P6_9HYPH|nr:VOC family protein [Hansschlegelia zhihuaiae]RXF68746.1 hypothetical protein EK403_19485 [Hansschlegelia zhihuaiae]
MAKPPGLGPTVFPALKYEDAPAAAAFLEKAFGFKPGLVVPGPGGGIAHAEYSIGDGGVMFGSMREADGEDPWAAARFGIYVVVEDIEAHYEAARAAGARIVRALEDTEYGSREYSALDPEGNIWSFGTYRPGDEGV